MAVGDTRSSYIQSRGSGQYGRRTFDQALRGFQGRSSSSSGGGSSSSSSQSSGGGGSDASYLDFFNWNKKGTKTQGFNIAGILKHLQQMTDENRMREESKLADSRRLLREGYDSGIASLDQYGMSAIRDINRAEAEGKAGATVSAIDRGLGNSTVVDALQQRVGEVAERQRQDVGERVSTAKSGLQIQRGESLAGLEERVIDEPPNLAAYLSLIQTITANEAAAEERNRADQLRLLELEALRDNNIVIGF